MPQLIPRQRVRGPSVGTAPSSGAAIATGLAQVGSALLGQAADQQFENEQLEIKQLERRETINANNAVIGKSVERLKAMEEIKTSGEPPEKWLDMLVEFEDKFDEEELEGASPVFIGSYVTNDKINRIQKASVMATSMSRAFVDESKNHFDMGIANADTIEAVNMMRKWGTGDGRLADAYIKKESDEKILSLKTDQLLGLPLPLALNQIELDDDLSDGEKRTLRDVVGEQEKKDRAIEKLSSSISLYDAERTIDAIAGSGADASAAQGAISSMPNGAAKEAAKARAVQLYGDKPETQSLPTSELKRNRDNLNNDMSYVIKTISTKIDDKKFKPNDPKSINLLNDLSDKLLAFQNDIYLGVSEGTLSPADGEDLMFHLDATIKTMGSRLESGTIGGVLATVANDYKKVEGTSIAKLASDNLLQKTMFPDNKDQRIYERSVIQRVGAIEDEYVNKPIDKQNTEWESIQQSAINDVARQRGIFTEKGVIDFTNQIENTRSISRRVDASVNSVLKIADANGDAISPEDAIAIGRRNGLYGEELGMFVNRVVFETSRNAE